MSIRILRTAIGSVALSLTLTPAWAQQGGHQMAGMAPGSGDGAARCAQNSEGVTRTIDVVDGRIEDARQTNDASKLRAAIGDLQVVFAQMKTQLAECVALAGVAGGGAMGNLPGMDHSHIGASAAKANPAAPSKMAGMDHSKMAGEKAAPAAGDTPAKAAPAAAVVFTVRTDPAPPRRGKNDFEVTLEDGNGRPIADAEVSLAFYIPPLPSMNMPEMRTAAQLTSAGNGAYKGSSTISMAGDWDVTITASRKGQALGTKTVKLTTK